MFLRNIFLIFNNAFDQIIRNCYWLVSILRIRAGRDMVFKFPLMIEGKGVFETGSKALFQKSVFIGLGVNASFKTGDNLCMDQNSNLFLVDGQKLHAGNDFRIGKGAVLQVHNNWQVGNNVCISSYCQVFSREKGCAGELMIGNDTNIGDFAIIDLSHNVEIGNNVAIGPRTIIYTHDHNYTESRNIPWHGTPVIKPVIIGDGAWIGSNVVILPGIMIGESAIIAAGSVVTRNVDAFSIFAGIPAKKIKDI